MKYLKGHECSNSGRTWIKNGERLSPQTEFQKGQTPWNKGLTGRSLEEISGKEKAQELKRRWSLTKKAMFADGKRKQPWAGKPISKELKDKKRKIWDSEEYKKLRRKIRSRQIMPFVTSIEQKIQSFLKELNISFISQHYIKNIKHKYRCDIFVPRFNLVIECDGDYWHANPFKYELSNLNEFQKQQMSRDFLRTEEMNEAGYIVMRLWETDIKNMNTDNFLKELAIIC